MFLFQLNFLGFVEAPVGVFDFYDKVIHTFVAIEAFKNKGKTSTWSC